jgi:hypothetical protein
VAGCLTVCVNVAARLIPFSSQQRTSMVQARSRLLCRDEDREVLSNANDEMKFVPRMRKF